MDESVPGRLLMLGKDTAWMAVHHGPVSNSFIVNDLRIMTETAAHLGFSGDARRYADALEKTRAAYIAAFVNNDGSMTEESFVSP